MTWAIPALLMACSGNPAQPITPIPTAPAVVVNPWLGAADALERHCTSCHAPGHIAEGWPLTTHDDAHRLRHAITAALDVAAMPPWPAGPSEVAFLGDRTLDPDTLAVIQEWLEADAPAWGDPPRQLQAEPEAVLPRVDLTLGPDTPYTPMGTTDDRRCFRLALPPDAPQWITGTRLLPGNPGVHHVIVVQAQPETDLTVLEDEDPEPGWDCGNRLRGGPDTTRLTGWVPGQRIPTVPEGTGFPRPVGADLVMVVHYWLPAMAGPTDLTQLQLMLDDTPSIEPLEYLLVRDDTWRPGAGMALEKGELIAEHRAVFDYDALSAGTRAVDPTDGLVLHAILPHMHEHGARTSVSHLRDVPTLLLDIPVWDFDWQLEYALHEPLVLSPGDAIEFECTYEGKGEAVAFGRSTEEEMCSVRLLVTGAGH